MRIAQISPLYESVPPKLYGGTERVVSYLTEELVRRGHEVTLFATSDSETRARLVGCAAMGLRLDPAVHDPLPHHLAMLERVIAMADEFEVLHFHTEYVHFPAVLGRRQRSITTIHGRTDQPDQQSFYRAFRQSPLVSISRDQRLRASEWNWVGTVHHGLPPGLLPFSPSSGGYLAFLGRISPDKGPDIAIEIAARTGVPLKIAAKIDPTDQPYWETTIEPLVRSTPNVDYVGEITEGDKAAFLGSAAALLFPIVWPEPFGLVLTESFACGTPVIAYRTGSVEEVVDDGVTGYIVDDIDAAVAAVNRLDQLDRAAVRRRFERRFTVRKMAEGYEHLYNRLIEQGRQERAVA